TWRDLKTVELGLLDGRRVVGLLRFQADGTKTGRLGLGHSSGKPGEQRVLTSGPLSLLLARSRVQGSGPTGKSVAIDFAVRAGLRLERRTLELQLSATDEHGTRQPFRHAGSLTVRS